MTESLRNIRRKVYLAYHQDGLDEILTAFTLVLIAVFFFNHSLGVVMVFGVGLHMPLKTLIRKRLTYPRAGYMKTPEPETKYAVTFIGLPTLVLGLLLIPLLALDYLGWILPLYVGFILTVVSLVKYYFYRIKGELFWTTLYILSGLFGLYLVSAGVEQGQATAVQMWLLAAIMIPVGFIKLLKFRRKYSGLKEGSINAEGIGQ
jgi:hypothetical protein